MAAPVLRSTGNGTNSGLSATITTTTPGFTVVGDLMLAIGRSRTTAVTPPAGWSTQATVAAGGFTVSVMYKILDNADIVANSYTFTGPAGRPNWTLETSGWGGVITLFGLPRLASNYDANGRAYPTTLDAPSILGHSNCVLHCAFSWRNGPGFASGTATSPTGMSPVVPAGATAGSNNDFPANELYYKDSYMALSTGAATGTQTLVGIDPGGGSFIEGLGISFLIVGTGVSFSTGPAVGAIRVA